MSVICNCATCGQGYDDGESDDRKEDDWLFSNYHEYPEFKQVKKVSVLDIRDRVSNIKNLIRVCREALSNSDLYDIRGHVTDVLYFYVDKELNTLDEELQKV